MCPRLASARVSCPKPAALPKEGISVRWTQEGVRRGFSVQAPRPHSCSFSSKGNFARAGHTNLVAPKRCDSFKGEKPTPKTTHPNKKSLRKQFSGLFVQTVLPLSFKLNKRYAERVWANCLPKLFSVGFIGVGGFLGWVFSLDS